METIERSVTLPTDIETAWSLVATPEELARWLGDEVAFEPTAGGSGRVVERDGTHRTLVVDEVSEGHRLTWRWWIEGEPETTSRVELTFAPTRDGTIVRVVEQQLEAPDPAGPARASASASVSGEAWSHRLLHLESLLLVAAAVRGG